MLDPQLGEIEFYLMKIGRLESDLIATQEQLMAARLRLRTAEDYQIKYQLLLKQYEQESERFKSYQIEEEEKIGQLITLKLKERDNFWVEKQNKLQKQINDKYTKQLNRVNQQFANFKKKHQRCGSKFDDQDILAFKNKKLQKQNQALQQKIAQMKKQYERTKEQELKSMKQSISSKNKQKQDNERKIYREKIQQLERNISDLHTNLLDARKKADPQRQKQIQRLKNDLQTQMDNNNEQIFKLSQAFIQKNKQIQIILDEKLKNQQALINEKKQLREFIRTLEDKLFQKEKQHEIQLIHLKERMSKIRQDEAQGLKSQLNKMQQTFNEQRQSWKIIITDKDKQVERMKNKYEEDTQRHKEDRAKQLRKIDQLKEKLKQYEGDKEAGQTEQLLKSMKDIEAKQEDFNNYENGVTFLDRQLKKAISKIQQKNIQITKLLKQLNQLRKQSETQINNLREKGRKDKKYHIDRITQLQQQIKILNQDIRNKQRQNKKKQKDLEAKITQINKQNLSLKDLIQQMQRDYTRILDSKKAIQVSYREQREKGLTSKSDLTMIKKQKWLQMERQKNQLEAIFKQKQEQLKNKHEIEAQKLRHERDQLKSQNQILKGLAQSVRREAGDDNKQNKQALYSQYHKKMATLNLQIALTKNIYDALVQAKSRKPKQSKVSEFQRIDEDASNSQQNQEGDSPFKDSNGPKFFTGVDIPKLAMSFNPNNK